MSKIRVVFCLDNMRIGGTELNAVRTAERLDKARFDLRVVTLQKDGPLLARYERAGIPVRHLPIPGLHSPGTVRQGIRLARWLRKERIEVFHSHDVYCNIFGAPFAWCAGIRAIIESRRWWDSLPRPGLRFANRLACRFASCVVANSPSVARLVEVADGIPRSRIQVIPNFVEERAFESMETAKRAELLKKFGIPPDAIIVGVIARLAPVKDHATLLEAGSILCERWPDVYYLLVGDGESRQDLMAKAGNLGLGHRVVFAGQQPHEPNLHHVFDISVLCSRDEAFPNTVIEAMAAGTPVVATAVGGVPDAIEDGVTGRLVPVSDPGHLATVLEELLARRDQREALGAAGRARARERYTPNQALSELEALYQRLVA